MKESHNENLSAFLGDVEKAQRIEEVLNFAMLEKCEELVSSFQAGLTLPNLSIEN